MERAIELSREGIPAPNPHVGCVIVQKGEIVGEGFHVAAGFDHAEVMALLRARTRAKDATLYVTLEPCNHHGRTPPCTDAILQAGVSRVVFATEDPNPKATGGASRLRDAGVNVEGGLLAEEAAQINERFLTAMRLRKPFVMVKAGISIDGRIALPSGDSQWITGEEARERAHWLRGQMGAILVGPGTVVSDDPWLTMRYREDSHDTALLSKVQPTRIVLDPRADLAPTARVFDSAAPTIRVLPESPTPQPPPRQSGEGELRLPLREGRFPIPMLLQRLFELGHTGVLVEGGGRTIGSFFQAGCVDAIELFVAPKVLGDGPSWVEGFGIDRLADAPEFKVRSIERVGDDLHMSLRPKQT